VTIKRRALGRGLAALIPAASHPIVSPGTTAVEPVPRDSQTPAIPMMSGTTSAPQGKDVREGLRAVGIEEIHPARSQPRKTFDDKGLNELAASIRSQGLIQPLVVRVRETGGYEIIAGERRWRAAQRAGLHTLPIVVREIASARAFELAMVENLQREDLNPIEEAEGFDRLIREFGYTQESLATRIGKDRTTVTNALRLLKLPPGVRALVIAGRLSMGHARAILGLEALAASPVSSTGTSMGSGDDVAERMERLARKAAGRELSVRQVEALVRREKDGTSATDENKDSARPTASGRDLATRLSRSLGTRVRVVEIDAGRGYLEIHYSSLDQLDGLLAKILI
jgi:ParB family transcriptional regulator, chromosome partitioning protein